jgi:hypothetical protein
MLKLKTLLHSRFRSLDCWMLKQLLEVKLKPLRQRNHHFNCNSSKLTQQSQHSKLRGLSWRAVLNLLMIWELHLRTDMVNTSCSLHKVSVSDQLIMCMTSVILQQCMRHQTQLTSAPLLVTMIQHVLHLTMVQKDTAMATRKTRHTSTPPVNQT